MSSRQLKRLTKAMHSAASYGEWTDAAQAHDDLSGARRWREIDQSRQYDYAQIRLRLDRLRSLRVRQDYHGLLYNLNEGIHGNMGGMGRGSLYRRACFGTKRLIEQYIEEIDDALHFLAELDSREIDVQEKIDFFYRANICYGRSALLLSGGGVLGFYHLGVVKTLLEQNLLPRVISGSSAGALVAAVVGAHNDKELQQFYDPSKLHFEAEREASVFSRLLFANSPQVDVGDLEKIVARLVPNMTFQQAYEKTGRQISISVAPAEPHQRSRLLNAITSPNVYLRSAVMASAAVPGVFPPVTLTAENAHGEAQPYLPTRRWVDGSIADDLPMKRLSRLFGVNHYIVSMVNPVVTPFLNRGEEQSQMAKALGGLGVGVGREVLNFYRGIAQRNGDNWPRFNMFLNGFHALMDQKYSGDINIVPNFRWYNPTKILSHLSERELLSLVEAGERATYPHIESIRTTTAISRSMEDILRRFEYGDLQPEPEKVHRPRASRRRPTPTKEERKLLRSSERKQAGKASVKQKGSASTTSARAPRRGVASADTKPTTKAGAKAANGVNGVRRSAA